MASVPPLSPLVRDGRDARRTTSPPPPRPLTASLRLVRGPSRPATSSGARASRGRTPPRLGSAASERTLVRRDDTTSIAALVLQTDGTNDRACSCCCCCCSFCCYSNCCCHSRIARFHPRGVAAAAAAGDDDGGDDDGGDGLEPARCEIPSLAQRARLMHIRSMIVAMNAEAPSAIAAAGACVLYSCC